MIPSMPSPYGSGFPGAHQRREAPSAFRELNATQLFCPKCRQAMPVREKLMLVLPTGDLKHYVCAQCGSTLGKKT